MHCTEAGSDFQAVYRQLASILPKPASHAASHRHTWADVLLVLEAHREGTLWFRHACPLVDLQLMCGLPRVGTYQYRLELPLVTRDARAEFRRQLQTMRGLLLRKTDGRCITLKLPGRAWALLGASGVEWDGRTEVPEIPRSVLFAAVMDVFPPSLVLRIRSSPLLHDSLESNGNPLDEEHLFDLQLGFSLYEEAGPKKYPPLGVCVSFQGRDAASESLLEILLPSGDAASSELLPDWLRWE